MIPLYQVGKINIALEEAPVVEFPTAADCNSSCWWYEGRLYILNSTGYPIRSAGNDTVTGSKGASM